MLTALARREPVAVQAVVLIVIAILTHFGVRLGSACELAINLAALAIVPAVTRRFVTPVSHPSAAVSAQPLPKEHKTMNLIQIAETDASALVAKGEAALSALQAFITANPALAGVETEALTAGVTDLATTAKSAVAADLPAAVQPTADDILAAIDAKAESDIAAIQSNALAAKSAVSAALPAAA